VRHRRRPLGTVGVVQSGRPTLLPDRLRLPAVALAALAAVVVGVLGVRYAGDSVPGRVDGHLDRAVDALPGHGIARMVIDLGSPAFVSVAAAVLAVICLRGRRFRAAALAVAGPGLTGLVTTVGKPAFDRTIGHGGDLAFPSGHTGGATALALVIALLVAGTRRWGPGGTAALAALCAITAGAAVGTGMVVAGQHYPTDVIGGFCTATAAVLAVALVLDATVRRRAPAQS
jgi:membrane-associated phospholipid phosphatase